jgi:hypothetical protein
MLERVLQIGQPAPLVQKLGGLEMSESSTDTLGRLLRDRLEEGKGRRIGMT